jgi:hypothetical protein
LSQPRLPRLGNDCTFAQKYPLREFFKPTSGYQGVSVAAFSIRVNGRQRTRSKPERCAVSVVIAAIDDAGEIDLLMTTYLSSTGIPPESFEVIFGGDRSSGGAAGPVRAWGHPKVPKEPVYLHGSGAPLGEPISQPWLFRNLR